MNTPQDNNQTYFVVIGAMALMVMGAVLLGSAVFTVADRWFGLALAGPGLEPIALIARLVAGPVITVAGVRLFFGAVRRLKNV